jgi:CHASE2 domain-containing sensor protein
MGKILSLLIGAIITVLGLILLIAWWYEFVFLLKGVIPILLILFGIIAIFAGIAELKDRLKEEKK